MKKILIANRGEIAVRIMKTAKRMGIKTVAVYSDADKNALHVKSADESVHIGPPASSESYLVQDKIIAAAKDTGADAIHPGYGFLSENAEFAIKVRKNGLIFIGPSDKSIIVMGSKLASKDAVKEYGIPLVPGTDYAIKDVKKGKQTAIDIGFPVLVKASAGGGGKGMKLVYKEEEFEEQFQLAKNEAKSAFGDDDVFIEKYIQSPRHIEFQVMFDQHGNGVHVLERECSIQRRHQKVIEETPSPKVDASLREKMGKDAVLVAKSCNYEGAGTVEFIMDADGKYYFLEMNTRLQVEHPITEMITGLDLVEWQIRVARGEKLGFTQEDIQSHGHAIELRIYAEDPMNNFLPSIGTLSKFQTPTGEGIRVDTGFEEGDEVPIYYDPMIAKLVVHDINRPLAIKKMHQAMNHFHIEGIKSTIEFGHYVLNHTEFQSGEYDTHFVGNYWNVEDMDKELTDEQIVAAQAAAHHWLAHVNAIKLPS
jgi:propionyl-CoA carboxylase alpha chain